MAEPLVLKIGGSLFERSEEITKLLVSEGCRALIIPGGGIFADMARRCRVVSDDSAHWMAILGMEQFGWYLASFDIPTTDTLEVPERLSILLPYRVLKNEDPLPHSWEVTSDTIAAWVAWRLHLDLVVLKHVDGIHSAGKLLESVDYPISTDDVDPSFIPYVISKRVKALVVNGTHEERIVSAVRRLPVKGTTIGF